MVEHESVYMESLTVYLPKLGKLIKVPIRKYCSYTLNELCNKISFGVTEVYDHYSKEVLLFVLSKDTNIFMELVDESKAEYEYPIRNLNSNSIISLRELTENIGPLVLVHSLESRFLHNEAKVLKVKSLCSAYSGYRSVRGDGNCMDSSCTIVCIHLVLDTD